MQFSQHFTYPKILAAVLSPIIMMLFTSLYSVADGLFLSNFAGKEAFAAVGFITPYLMMFNSVGFLFGTGGSALIAKLLGEKKCTEANETFSTLIVAAVCTGLFLSGIGQLFLKPVAVLQGAEGALLANSLLYGRIYLLGTPACLIQFAFQALYQTSGKGRLGLKAAVISGLTNIVLDAVLLAVFSFGTAGAAVATVFSQWIGGALPLVYYSRKNDSQLRLVRARFHGRELLQMCANGSSEMVNNVSISVVSLVYNMQLLAYAGSDGIAAYGIMNYVNFLFTAVFWGYISGIAPIISFHYGAGNHGELHSLLKKSILLILGCSCTMFFLSELLAKPIAASYAGREAELMQMSVHGFRLFAVTFLFAGLSIFFSSFFTALNNGLISAMLSLCRVFAFQIPAVLLLPLIWKLDGIWISVGTAELLTVLLGVLCLFRNQSRYHY